MTNDTTEILPFLYYIYKDIMAAAEGGRSKVMRTYSIVFLDIDGTLLNSEHQVMPCTRNHLQQLHQRGIPIILCSARPPEGVNLVANQVGIHGPMACYNGGLVFDQDGTILRDVGIDTQLAIKFKEFAGEQFPDVVVNPYLYNVWIADDPQNPMVLREAEISHCTPLKGSLEQAAASVPHVHKLLCMGDPKQIRALQIEASRNFPNLMALRSKPEYLEILSPESTKGGAVQVLLDHYRLRPEKAVAFGDSDVDVDMLKYCGLGVAMANAPKSVKEAAGFVTASNDEEGIYIALNNLRLKAPGKNRNSAKI